MTHATTPQQPAPNPIGANDVAALIGWLVSVEGEMMGDAVPASLIDKLRRRLVADDLLPAGGDERAMRQAINDMSYRLRYTLGELAEPPESSPVPD